MPCREFLPCPHTSHTRPSLPPIIRSQNNLTRSYHIRPSLVPRFQGKRIDHPCAIRFAPSGKRVVARASHGIPVAGPHRRAWFPRQDAGTHPQTHKHNNTHALLVHLVVGVLCQLEHLTTTFLHFFTSPLFNKHRYKEVQPFFFIALRDLATFSYTLFLRLVAGSQGSLCSGYQTFLRYLVAALCRKPPNGVYDFERQT